MPDPFAANTRSTHSRGRPTSTWCGRGGEHRIERRRDLVDTEAGQRVDDDDRPVDAFLDLEARELERVFVDERRLRQRDHPVADLEQVEDLRVLLGLRHPSFVRGNHEQRDIDRADPGEHVLHEPHMAGNVDEAHDLTRRQRAEREPEVDRQAARLLLREPIGVGAGEREDERRLAVIDVARGRDDSHAAPGPAGCAWLLTAQ